MKKQLTKSQQGRKSRRDGAKFEQDVRKDLESKGWIVFKNQNDVEFDTFYDDEGFKMPLPEGVKKGIFKPAKSKWNPFTKRPMNISQGFPDFLCVRWKE